MTDRELMQQALDLLDDINQCSLPPTGIPLPAEIDHVMEALRARLSQPEPKIYSDIDEMFRDMGVPVTEPEPEPEPVAWRPIETAPKGRIVLVHYKNQLGNGRTMRARYYLPETLESDTTESGWSDEGWYEESEAYEYLMPLDGDPTHWMPLPPAPDTTPPQREWQGLTDGEINEMHYQIKVKGMGSYKTEDIYRAIEAKLKEKNT